LAEQSSVAKEMYDALDKSELNYSIRIDPKADTRGSPGYFDPFTREIVVNPNVVKQWEIFNNQTGKWVPLSVNQVILHELGHAMTYERGGQNWLSNKNPILQNQAIDWGNRALRQIDPNAPMQMTPHGAGLRRVK
jgi:hypothetical protein